MSRHQPYPDSEMSVRIMVGDPLAIAFKWIEAYTENINSTAGLSEPISLDEMIDVGFENAQGSNGWNSYISRPELEGFRNVDPTFWDKLSILKEIEIEQHNRNSFFTCSC